MTEEIEEINRRLDAIEKEIRDRCCCLRTKQNNEAQLISKKLKTEKIIAEEKEFLKERRQMFDQLVWQIPSLSLTGESFLFLISLGAAVSNIARIISSVLGIVVALASIISLDRLKTCEWYDARALTARRNLSFDSDGNPLDDENSELVKSCNRYPISGDEYRESRAKVYSKSWETTSCFDFKGDCCTWSFHEFTGTRIWTATFWLILFANVVILTLSCIQQSTGDDRFLK